MDLEDDDDGDVLSIMVWFSCIVEYVFLSCVAVYDDFLMIFLSDRWSQDKKISIFKNSVKNCT